MINDLRTAEPRGVGLFRNSEKEDAVGSYQMVDVSQVEARNGIFRALTDQLGVERFRINQLELAAGAEGPEHDHIGNDQEEVYAVVAGGGVLRTGGEEIRCAPATLFISRRMCADRWWQATRG
jgi:uncharacterized cupin superfamily protein